MFVQFMGHASPSASGRVYCTSAEALTKVARDVTMGILALQKSTANDTTRKCIPNLLPCRIHRDGPVDATPRYWSPEIDKGTFPRAHTSSSCSA